MQIRFRVKGISPLVAAVLLIAVTMTIAGVLAYWASTFVRQQTALFSNETVASECNFGSFLVDSCRYNSTTSEMRIILNNIGSIELHDLRVFAIYPDGTVSETPSNASVAKNSLSQATFNPVSPGFSRITIRTQCSNVLVENVACGG